MSKMNPIKLFLIISIVIFAGCNNNFKKLIPQEHSGKWINENEECILQKDSVLIKMHYVYLGEPNQGRLVGYHAVVIEITNQSLAKDILIEPRKFKSLWYSDTAFAKKSVLCDDATFVHPEEMPEITRFIPNFLNEMLTKTTIEPSKTLKGYLVFENCFYGKSPRVELELPIAGQTFNFRFITKK
jgi:hypothetical protein